MNYLSHITKPAEKVINRLKWYKLTKRTWAQKTEKKRARQQRRKRKHSTNHLPVILNFNSRSICNKNVDLKQIVDDNKADIIIITETWINSSNESVQLNMLGKDNPEYEIISQKRTREDVSRGGGIIIMVKKSYSQSIKQIKTQQQPSPDNNQLLESIIDY